MLGHADWYGGNTAVSTGPEPTLVATFDWELVVDAEAVIVGFAAASYAASPTGPGGLSSPEEALVFLREYEDVRGARMSPAEQRAAAAAVTWILAFNARWQVGLLDHAMSDLDTIEMVRRDGDRYLELTW